MDHNSATFHQALSLHLEAFKSAVILEYEKDISSIKDKNRSLREQLHAVESQQVNGSSNGNSVDSFACKAEWGTVGDLDTLAAEVVATSMSVEVQENETLVVPTDTLPEENAPMKRQTSPGLRRSRTSRDMEEVARQPTFLERIVGSTTFECVSGAVILANTAIMALQLQYDAIDIGYDIGAGNFKMNARDTWPNANSVFYFIDVVFNVVFCLELILRVCALRWKALRSGWIWFDVIVVAVSCIDTFGSAALPVNPGMLRVLRLVRLVRLFKILKAMQEFDSLFLLIKSITASMTAAIWSFGMLVAVQTVVGLFLNQLMHTFLVDNGDAEMKDLHLVYQYYGTFSGTMLTMFELTMGSWSKPGRVLVECVNEWFILFIIIYRCFFCFAVLKVIAAVFITETNRVLQHDDELTLMKVHRERTIFDKKVRTLLNTFEEDIIGWHELKEIAYDPEIKTHLITLGLNPHDLEKLFFLIENGDGKVRIKDFLARIGSLQGQAKAVDMQTVLKLTHKINQELQTVFQKQGLLEKHAEEEEMEAELCC